MTTREQSLISLMYASRAKKIRNQSSVNVDTAGQSNIHQVSNPNTYRVV